MNYTHSSVKCQICIESLMFPVFLHFIPYNYRYPLLLYCQKIRKNLLLHTYKPNIDRGERNTALTSDASVLPGEIGYYLIMLEFLKKSSSSQLRTPSLSIICATRTDHAAACRMSPFEKQSPRAEHSLAPGLAECLRSVQ